MNHTPIDLPDRTVCAHCGVTISHVNQLRDACPGSGAELDAVVTLRAIQGVVGTCREWVEEKADRCNELAEYVLWGKLIDPKGLGPRCYDHAAKWVSASALAPKSGWALIDLCELVEAIRAAHGSVASREGQR